MLFERELFLHVEVQLLGKSAIQKELQAGVDLSGWETQQISVKTATKFQHQV